MSHTWVPAGIKVSGWNEREGIPGRVNLFRMGLMKNCHELGFDPTKLHTRSHEEMSHALAQGEEYKFEEWFRRDTETEREAGGTKNEEGHAEEK